MIEYQKSAKQIANHTFFSSMHIMLQFKWCFLEVQGTFLAQKNMKNMQANESWNVTNKLLLHCGSNYEKVAYFARKRNWLTKQWKWVSLPCPVMKETSYFFAIFFQTLCEVLCNFLLSPHDCTAHNEAKKRSKKSFKGLMCHDGTFA